MQRRSRSSQCGSRHRLLVAYGIACMALSSSIATAAGSALEGDWSSSGHFASQLRSRLSDGHAISATQRIWLDGQWNSRNVSLLASAYLDWDQLATYRSSTVRSQLHELSVGTYLGEWRLDAGRRRLRWGAADGRSVLDLINPLDLSDPFAGGMRNTARLPTALATLERDTLGGRLQLVWVPRAGVGKLPEFGSPWEPQMLRQQRAAAGFSRARMETAARPEYGARWIRYGTGFDLEILAYEGYAREPLPLGRGRFVTPPASTFGIAVQTVLGGNGLRGEIAWEPDAQRVQQTTGTLAASPRLRTVAGWDRQFGEGPYANLQAYVDWQATSPPDKRASQHRHGLTYLIRDRFIDGSVESGVRGILQTSDHSGSAEIYVQWEKDDRWRFDASLMRLWGPRTSEYGVWRRQSSVRISARRSF